MNREDTMLAQRRSPSKMTILHHHHYTEKGKEGKTIKVEIRERTERRERKAGGGGQQRQWKGNKTKEHCKALIERKTMIHAALLAYAHLSSSLSPLSSSEVGAAGAEGVRHVLPKSWVIKMKK